MMGGRYVYIIFSILVVNFISISSDGKRLYIKDTIKVKPFDNRLDSKKLNKMVTDAIAVQFRNRKMLEVSNTRSKLHMIWRGARRFFWENVLKVFCPSINRELKTAKLLKEMLYNNAIIQNKLGIFLPPQKPKLLANDEDAEKNNDKESDEKSDNKSDEESDEDDERSKKTSKKTKKSTQKSKKSKSSEEDEDEDEEDTKKKSSRKISKKSSKKSKKSKSSEEDKDDEDEDEEDTKKKSSKKSKKSKSSEEDKDDEDDDEEDTKKKKSGSLKPFDLDDLFQ